MAALIRLSKVLQREKRRKYVYALEKKEDKRKAIVETKTWFLNMNINISF